MSRIVENVKRYGGVEGARETREGKVGGGGKRVGDV
jgi:hypothetical protein